MPVSLCITSRPTILYMFLLQISLGRWYKCNVFIQLGLGLEKGCSVPDHQGWTFHPLNCALVSWVICLCIHKQVRSRPLFVPVTNCIKPQMLHFWREIKSMRNNSYIPQRWCKQTISAIVYNLTNLDNIRCKLYICSPHQEFDRNIVNIHRATLCHCNIRGNLSGVSVNKIKEQI